MKRGCFWVPGWWRRQGLGGDWPTLDWVEDDWTRVATLDDDVR